MAETSVAAAKKKYVPAPLLGEEEIAQQIKPLSENKFVAFFQKIWRAFLAWWYSFSDKHPKGSKLLYMLGFFILFSQAVTIWQFIVMTFMPYLFGGLNQVDLIVPKIPLGDLKNPADGTQLFYAIFNEPAAVAGKLGGLGNFIAFEIAVFTAQCINFPLQRNITFKSHGNPVYQAMWYFIGWVGISVFVNALWGIVNPFMLYWQVNFVLAGLLKTFITGGISMAIFFPIFLVIFPDYNKVEKTTRAKIAKLKADNAPFEQIAKAEAVLRDVEIRAKMNNADKAQSKNVSKVGAMAIAYFAAAKALEKAKIETSSLEGEKPGSQQLKKARANLVACKKRVPDRQQQVSDMVAERDRAAVEFPEIKAEYDAYIAQVKAGTLPVAVRPPVAEPEVAPVVEEVKEDQPVWTEVPDDGAWVEHNDTNE